MRRKEQHFKVLFIPVAYLKYTHLFPKIFSYFYIEEKEEKFQGKEKEMLYFFFPIVQNLIKGNPHWLPFFALYILLCSTECSIGEDVEVKIIQVDWVKSTIHH